MKIGGNAAFNEFLARHPGSTSGGNTKDKYTSNAANKYKEELAKRAAADLAQFGIGHVVLADSGVDIGGAAAVKEKDGGNKDDFFDTWDKPAVPKPKSNDAVSTPPQISLTPTSSRPATPRSASPALPPAAEAKPIPPAAPRTISSSSLRNAAPASAGGRAKLGSRLGSATGSGTSTMSSVGGKSKLGAKKANVTINFEEAERKAAEEEARIKKLGYDSMKEAEEAVQRQKDAASAQAAQAARDTAAASAAGKPARRSTDNERLGMGMARLGFGQTMGVSGEESARQAEQTRKAAARKAAGFDDGVLDLS